MSFMNMCYGRTCVVGGHVFAGLCRSNHLSCCEFRHLVVVFSFYSKFCETCFPRIYCLNILLG